MSTPHYDSEEDPYDIDAGTIMGDEFDEELRWTCAFPDRCLMPSHHMRDECHTVEDAEAYYKEALG